MCDDIDNVSIEDLMFKNIGVCNEIVKIETFNRLLQDSTLENGVDILQFVRALKQGSIILLQISHKFMSLKSKGKNDVGVISTYKQIMTGRTPIEQQKREVIDVVIEANAKKNVESFDNMMKMKRKREEENAIFKELADLLTDIKRTKHAVE